MGLGMIYIDCNVCDGSGDYREQDKPSMKIVDKRSSAYKDAINDIMKLNPEITRKDAQKMFEEAFDKV